MFFVFFTNDSSYAKNECSKYSEATSKDKEYRISFGDSGVGGLIFSLDVLQELETKLKDLESKYEIKFIFHHVGDSKNAPYGSKTPDQIKDLTKSFTDYMANLPNTRTPVIACNTASTVYDADMDALFKKKYPNLSVITMIDDSSKAIIDSATSNVKNKRDVYIALLATPATIKSGSYQTQIKNITDSNKQNLRLHTYSPEKWVKNIEGGVDKKMAESDVANDLEIFKNQIGKDFKKIKVAGLFCTHYPFYKNEIKDFFTKNGNENVKILTQGNIFSDKIYKDILLNISNDNYQYHKRKSLVPQKCVEEIAINSDVTGDNIQQMKNTIDKTHPQYAKKINFRYVSF